MVWSDIVRKLTSRRLWVAVAGIVTGVALALGGSESEIQSMAGAITALLSALGYMATEASVDKARANGAVLEILPEEVSKLDTGEGESVE